MRKKLFLFFTVVYVYVGLAQNPYFEISKQMEIYNDVLKKLSTNYIEELNIGDLVQKNTKKMLNSLDRFTTFYDEQGILDEKMRQEGHFGGLGIRTQYRDSVIVITDILKKSPAYDQLQIGDRILEIEKKDVAEMDRKMAHNLLKGAVGSEVSLLIERNKKKIPVTITRADIALDAVTVSRLDGEIGYIRLVKFNKKASQQVKKALIDLKKQGATSLIIDVRNNPGGLLNEVIKIVNFFIPKGKVVVTTKGRFKKYNRTYKTNNESVDEEMPLVILVNNRSASASEILSGALQDYDRAVIIGDTTYGKGLVQRTYPLKYGTYIKQTISKYYIPSGRLIQKKDYWNRDKNGKPLPMRLNLPEKEFTTINGRKVYNLGGIIPDIVIDGQPQHSLIGDLLKKNYLFDFATWYYYHQNRPKNPIDFKLKEADFELLLEYLKKHNLNPKSTAENTLEKAYKKAQKEKQGEQILTLYKQLLKAYQHTDEFVLRKYQSYILDYINLDLSNRYFGIEGYTTYMLLNDKALLKAKEVLKNKSMYDQILNR